MAGKSQESRRNIKAIAAQTYGDGSEMRGSIPEQKAGWRGTPGCEKGRWHILAVPGMSREQDCGCCKPRGITRPQVLANRFMLRGTMLYTYHNKPFCVEVSCPPAYHEMWQLTPKFPMLHLSWSCIPVAEEFVWITYTKAELILLRGSICKTDHAELHRPCSCMVFVGWHGNMSCYWKLHVFSLQMAAFPCSALMGC